VSSSVTVWDQRTDPPPARAEVICWQSYHQSDHVVSVPRYLEEHAERIRGRYLAFIHELGGRQVAGRPIADHLNLGDGLSFWWLTQVAEKSPFKSPRIYHCLRLLCLEEILLQRRPTHLALVSSDGALASALGRLCAHLRIPFRFERQPRPPGIRRSPARRVYEAMPHPLRGLLSLRHVLRRWPLRRARPQQWFGGESALFICSYFIHLDPRLCAQGQFHSRQWEDLPRAVHERGGRLNWLQLFLFSSVVPTVRRGLQWVGRFNANAPQQGRHAFLDSYLTLPRLLTALAMWMRLTLIAWRLRGVHAAFYAQESGAWLWPFLRDDWHASVTGPIAVSNCLAVVLFDAALADIPRQEMGLYLCENQSWEKALLRAWRRHGHGEIVGVQHATAPFWHLYYFDDPRSLAAQGSGSLPLPDRLAVNGADARRAFAAAGYPLERLVDVEALRYLQLQETAERAQRRTGRQPARRVLILGDITAASMCHLLELLQGAAGLLPADYLFTFKPHPGYAADLGACQGLRVVETREALGQILSEHDVAVAANSTSAAVDAFVAGLPVIIALDGGALNLSPLRGRVGVRFVTTAAELAQSLQSVAGDASMAERADFFYLDRQLPRWQRLLGSAAHYVPQQHGCTARARAQS
jgi:surface carbohydrate biosynthesis protein (TIGR04326 family)